MPSGTPVTAETAARVQALRRCGLARKEIATRVGLSYSAVAKYTRPLCRCPRLSGVAAFFWDAGAA